MGLTVRCNGVSDRIEGSKTVDSEPRVEMVECFFGGPDLVFDASWIGEVAGLEKVIIRKMEFRGGTYGRAELTPLLVGRTHAVIVPCRHCGSMITGDEGAPDVCPDELSYRCILSS